MVWKAGTERQWGVFRGRVWARQSPMARLAGVTTAAAGALTLADAMEATAATSARYPVPSRGGGFGQDEQAAGYAEISIIPAFRDRPAAAQFAGRVGGGAPFFSVMPGSGREGAGGAEGGGEDDVGLLTGPHPEEPA